MDSSVSSKISGIILSLLLVVPVSSGAQVSDRGRLQNGSAYRTTRDGIQLVDHVAELEVSVEEMKRQIEAAHNEIALKDVQIEKLERAAAAPIQPVAFQCPPQPQLICPEVSQDELVASRTELKDLKSQFDKVKKEADAQNVKLNRENSKSGEVLQARDQEISLLRARLKISDEQVTLLKSLNSVTKNESVRASVSLPQAASPQSNSLPSSLQPRPADEQKVRQQTLESYRKGVRSELTQVRDLMQQRDALFARYASSGKSLQIKPSTANSSQNRGIDQLQKDVEAETSLRMIALMGREVHEIREKVSDDIELVKRIGKF